MSYRRKRLNRRGSERYFSRTADRTHRKNFSYNVGPMRGGIRL